MNNNSYALARNTDPLTSHLAAQSMDPSVHHSLILKALDTPAGKSLIAQRSGLDQSQVSRRMNELEKMGVIGLTGKNIQSSSNRQEREWVLVQ